jgi:hypothetical protein
MILLFRGLESNSPYCTLADAMDDVYITTHLEARAAELAAAASKAETRGALELRQTPLGDYWTLPAPASIDRLAEKAVG